MHSRLILPLQVAALLLVSVPLGAQNLVTNGDFEGGTNSSGLPNGWTFSGYALSQKVDQADVTGGGASNCFNLRPGGQQTPPPYPPYVMEQNVLLVQGIVHEFRADIMSVATTGNADGGTIEVFLDNVSAGKHAFGNISSNSTERTRLCLRAVPQTSGSKMLRITFHRSFLNNTTTPVCYIDNIFLGRAQSLTVCFPGERKAGGNVTIQAQGSPGYLFALFLGVGQANPPVHIPGWTGQWELQSPYVPLVIGNLDNSGLWSVTAPATAAAQGFKAWIQGAQAMPPSPVVVHLGHSQEVNVY